MNPSNKARPPGSRADNRGVWANHSSEALGRGLRLCVDAKLDQRGLLRGNIVLLIINILQQIDNEVGMTTLN